jgi:hypothetical protein
MPPFAIAAARLMTRRTSEFGGGIGVARRTYAAIAAVLGLALVSLTLWLPAPIALTPAQRGAIPPVALALGIALLVSAPCCGTPPAAVAPRARRERHALIADGTAGIVRLPTAVGEDRSRQPAQVIQYRRRLTRFVGVSAFCHAVLLLYRPSRRRTGSPAIVADRYEQFLNLPGSSSGDVA